MDRRIMIIQGHPDRSRQHLCHGLQAAYLEAAEQAGHSVRLLRLADLKFPLLSSEDAWYGELPAELESSRAALEWADHIVIFYPLWLGTMPALLKAYLEQLFRPGIALADERSCGEWPRQMLRGKSCRVVITMGMPAWFYRWFYFSHSLRSLERNILRFCGIRPVRESLYGLVAAASEERRRGWLRQMARLGARAG